MRRRLVLLVALIACAAPAFAAQPSITAATSCNVIAGASASNCTITGVTAGRGIGIAILQVANGSRTFSAVTDKSDLFSSGGTTGTPDFSQASCPAATNPCLFFMLIPSAVGGNTQVTVTQSAALVTYGFVAFEITCGASGCAKDRSSSNAFTTTANPVSAAAGELDTAAEVVVIVFCAVTANPGTMTQPSGYETIADPGTTTAVAFEDDSASAYSDEQGQWTFASSTGACMAVSVKNGAAATTRSGVVGGGLL